MPFCQPDHFAAFFNQLKESLQSGGIISCELFGKNDSWNSPIDQTTLTFLSRAEIEGLMSGLKIEELKEEEYDGPSFSDPQKHWQVRIEIKTVLWGAQITVDDNSEYVADFYESVSGQKGLGFHSHLNIMDPISERYMSDNLRIFRSDEGEVQQDIYLFHQFMSDFDVLMMKTSGDLGSARLPIFERFAISMALEKQSVSSKNTQYGMALMESSKCPRTFGFGLPWLEFKKSKSNFASQRPINSA